MSSPFPYSAGPRLADEPRGDPAAQAIASLRGYAYQLYATALAWLDLRPGQELYLEVAKDYATAAENALNAVEVKDTQASITINLQDVRDTFDSFVDLVERNPDRTVNLQFLSTSSIGQERATAHRIGSEGALIYWRRASAGADVAPLREVLSQLDLTPRVRAYIDARDDAALRRDFLLSARLQGGTWYVVDFRDASAVETAERIHQTIAGLNSASPSGIILDDLNELEDPLVRRNLNRLIFALKRRDSLCLITAYRQCTSSL